MTDLSSTDQTISIPPKPQANAKDMETTTSTLAQTPSSICRFCNNLRHWAEEPKQVPLPFPEWKKGLLESVTGTGTCGGCKLLHKLLQMFDPEYLAKEDSYYKQKVHGYSVGVTGAGQIDIMHVRPGLYCTHTTGREFEFFTEGDVPPGLPAFVGQGRELAASAGDAEMWEFLRRCLNECLAEHIECSGLQDETWYPERLVHVQPAANGQGSDDKPRVVLVETSSHQPTSRYITLSHCWGSVHPFRTMNDNVERQKQGIAWDDLPRTFQDCITVALRLGVSYVWIDALCIIQDERSDWARHAGVMDKVYENSLFTVSARSSPSSEVPFLGPEAPGCRKDRQARDIDISEVASESPCIIKVRFLKHYDCNEPLRDRAWPWQENFLSQRNILFRQTQSEWHCKQKVFFETAKRGLSGWPIRKLDDKETHQGWRDVTTRYSTLKLTYPSDRLPALSGIAARFQKSLQSEYLAGVWLSDFPRCFGWYKSVYGQRFLDSLPGVVDDTIPSWSWLSVGSNTGNTITWLSGFDFDSRKNIELPLQSCVELVDYTCNPLHDNPYGEVEPGAHVQLKGKVILAQMESDMYGRAIVRLTPSGPPQFVTPDCRLVAVPAAEDDSISAGTGSTGTSDSWPAAASFRRAHDTDTMDKTSPSVPSTGTVHCLLLYTVAPTVVSAGANDSEPPDTDAKNSRHACILILGEQQRQQRQTGSRTDLEKKGENATFQRLGLAYGGDGRRFSSPSQEYLTVKKRGYEVWTDWVHADEVGYWAEWERWFGDVEASVVTVV